MENFPLINSHNLLANPLLFPTEITNLLSKQLAAEINFGFLKKLVEIRYLTNVPAKADC